MVSGVARGVASVWESEFATQQPQALRVRVLLLAIRGGTAFAPAVEVLVPNVRGARVTQDERALALIEVRRPWRFLSEGLRQGAQRAQRPGSRVHGVVIFGKGFHTLCPLSLDGAQVFRPYPEVSLRAVQTSQLRKMHLVPSQVVTARVEIPSARSPCSSTRLPHVKPRLVVTDLGSTSDRYHARRAMCSLSEKPTSSVRGREALPLYLRSIENQQKPPALRIADDRLAHPCGSQSANPATNRSSRPIQFTLRSDSKVRTS
eukprot:scaffold38486_cov75-Phaeocystis_antarctica.AAC.5